MILSVMLALILSLILSLMLALILGLGSVDEAMARAAMIGGSAVVICGAGPVTLDADGKPLPAGQPCTHCLAAVALVVGPAVWQGLRPALLVATQDDKGDYVAPRLDMQRCEPARGPPWGLI